MSAKAHTLEDLKDLYKDSLWLKSELTYIEMIDAAEHFFNRIDRSRARQLGFIQTPPEALVTVHSRSATPYRVETIGGLSFVVWPNQSEPATLVLFSTIFYDSLVPFAVLSENVEYTSPPQPS